MALRTTDLQGPISRSPCSHNTPVFWDTDTVCDLLIKVPTPWFTCGVLLWQQLAQLTDGNLFFFFFFLFEQRSATSWWSSSNAWSSSRSLVSSCSRTCRSSFDAKQRSNWNIPAAWRNWPSASPPRSAAPENISNSSECAALLVW